MDCRDTGESGITVNALCDRSLPHTGCGKTADAPVDAVVTHAIRSRNQRRETLTSWGPVIDRPPLSTPQRGRDEEPGD